MPHSTDSRWGVFDRRLHTPQRGTDPVPRGTGRRATPSWPKTRCLFNNAPTSSITSASIALRLAKSCTTAIFQRLHFGYSWLLSTRRSSFLCRSLRLT